MTESKTEITAASAERPLVLGLGERSSPAVTDDWGRDDGSVAQ